MARDLLVDTAVTAIGPGRYRAEVPADWNAAMFIFGGVPMTVGMRAAAAELDDDRLIPRSLNAVFCQPFTAGGMIAEVDVLRAGRAAQQVSVDVTTEGAESSPGMRMVATYAPTSDHPLAFTELEFPDDIGLPSEMEGPPILAPDDVPIPVIRQLEMYPVLGHTGFGHTAPGPARSARWVKFREPVGGDMPSIAVHADELGLSVMQRQSPDAPFSMVISLDIGIHFVSSPTSEWVLLDSTATEAGQGFASGIVNLWDESKNLVAVATQRALLKTAPAHVRDELAPHLQVK
jgi:acyl-CoA thioesterase